MGKRGAIKAAGSTVPGAGRGRGRPNKTGGFHGPGAGRGVARRPEKKKTNSAPKDLDTQEIPFKLREIMRSQLEMDKPKKKKRPAQKQGPHNEELQTDIQVPKFKQKKNESVHSYLQRMNSATQHVMFLSKNQPDRMPEMELDEKGMPRKELDEKGMPEKELGKRGMAVQVAQSKKEKSQNKKEFDQRRLMKFLKKKDDKKATLLEKELLTDKVMFGEVVMAPPTLTVKPRKSVDKTKPGEKQLLLKNILAKASSAAPPPAMSFARKRMLEDERERVVQAYRDLKKRKQQQSEDSKSQAKERPSKLGSAKCRIMDLTIDGSHRSDNGKSGKEVFC